MKIVIHDKYGGFRNPLTGGYNEIPRNDPELVKYVESHPDKGGLVIIEIPDDVDWMIDDYDGKECVAEKHRRWYPE